MPRLVSDINLLKNTCAGRGREGEGEGMTGHLAEGRGCRLVFVKCPRLPPSPSLPLSLSPSLSLSLFLSLSLSFPFSFSENEEGGRRSGTSLFLPFSADGNRDGDRERVSIEWPRKRKWNGSFDPDHRSRGYRFCWARSSLDYFRWVVNTDGDIIFVSDLPPAAASPIRSRNVGFL